MVIDALVRLPAEPSSARAAADLLLEDMTLAGVRRAVAVAPDATLADLHRAHPGTFAGIGRLGPGPAVADLEARIAGVRIEGVLLPTAFASIRLLSAVRDLDLKAVIAPGADQLAELDGTLTELPGLQVPIDPPAGAGPDAALDRLARHPTAFVLLTSGFLRGAGERTRDHPPWPRCTTASGPIGWDGYLEALALVDRYLPGLPAGARTAIRGGSAAALFTF